jgi:GDSL-like Lipase/Acylhydrolase family
MSRRREWLTNIAVSIGSVILLLALCEFVVFRLIWSASDVPANAFSNDVVRYVPGQTGVWRVRDEIAAPYVINAQGWNSGVGDYATARTSGVARIAIVGDSFVEALQVPYNRSFGECIGQEHGQAEVYRLAVAGAPMSQYLHIVEREVGAYNPDWIVVLLVHNDFDEAFTFKQGRYTSSFRKLRIEDGRVADEIAPEPWRPGATEWLRRTALARFFLYRWQVRPQTAIDFFLSPARANARHAANIEISAVLAKEKEIRVATEYVVERIAARAKDMGAKLLIAMDGDRQAIYAGRTTSEPLMLNRIAAEAAARSGVTFVDLHPVFAAEWNVSGRRFEFNSDAHWNEYGHAVAAGAIASAMRGMKQAAADQQSPVTETVP